MALMQTSFFSDVLGLSCTMNVIVPQQTARQIGMAGQGNVPEHGYPTLYLLHGMSDDHSIWLRRTSIERYVAPLGLAVVMPAVMRSFYTDQMHGLKYWQFISEELPATCRQFFRLSARREDNFVAGLSMGGYGAFKLAMAQPEKWAAGASLSGATWIRNMARGDRPQNEMVHTFGPLEDIEGSPNDLGTLAEQLAGHEGDAPRLYQCCGEEDFLWEDNLKFLAHARELGLDLTWEQDPGYGHTWDYWDLKIQRVLRWLPLQREQTP